MPLLLVGNLLLLEGLVLEVLLVLLHMLLVVVELLALLKPVWGILPAAASCASSAVHPLGLGWCIGVEGLPATVEPSALICHATIIQSLLLLLA